MIDCIHYSLPSGDFAILHAVHRKSLYKRYYKANRPIEVYVHTYHCEVECWDRRTGACHLHKLDLAYRREGYVSGGEWVCYKHELALRQPTTKSRYRETGLHENASLSLGKVSSDNQHVVVVDCLGDHPVKEMLLC